MEFIVLVLLILFLVGGLPTWGYSRNWGYGPSGVIGTLLLIFLILWLFGAFAAGPVAPVR